MSDDSSLADRGADDELEWVTVEFMSWVECLVEGNFERPWSIIT